MLLFDLWVDVDVDGVDVVLCGGKEVGRTDEVGDDVGVLYGVRGGWLTGERERAQRAGGRA